MRDAGCGMREAEGGDRSVTGSSNDAPLPVVGRRQAAGGGKLHAARRPRGGSRERGLPGLTLPLAVQLRLDKPWTPLTADNARRLPGQLGVYELADEGQAVVYIGFAGGRSLFGLRGEIERHVDDPRKRFFRVEVNQQYQTRWRELLMLHNADHGDVPGLNRLEPLPRLGRIG